MQVSERGLNIGAFGSKFTYQPKTGGLKPLTTSSPMSRRAVISAANARVCPEPLVDILVLRVPVQRGIDVGCGENRVRGMAERPDDFRQRIT